MKIIFSPTKTMKKIQTNYEFSIPNLDVANKINEVYDVIKEESNHAIFFYNGISFKYLNALSLNETNINYLNNNLIILSALYGCLRPLDKINEYRLDFTDKTLYKYHDIFIDDTVINLASNEYLKMIKCSNLINIEFNEFKNNKLTTSGTYNKMLRGLMVRYMSVNNISNVEELKKFSELDYYFNDELSNSNNLVFIKNQENDA